MNHVVYSGILTVALTVGLSHGLPAQEQRMASAPMPVESMPQSKAPAKPATTAPAAPTVTVSVKDMPRLDALRSVVKSAGYDLMYSRSVISLPGRVDVKFSKTPLAEAVQKILNGTDVTAEISVPTKTVRLSPRDTTVAPAQTPARGTLRGRVIDSTTKQPVTNVTITVPGTSARTLTQDNGTYSMTVPAGAHTVIARRIGYQERQLSVTVPGGGSVSADFVLMAAPSVLSEVVTTGSGDRAKVEVGNSIATIDAEEVVENNAIVNLSDLLRGRAQGLDVIQSSGIVGAPSRIRIRGINSINSSNDPIIIMDGIRLATNYETARDGNIHGADEAPSRIDDIDPNIIESIEVLKGPSAAALWGADAANGVIVIKTKRGRSGTTRWTIRADRGWALAPDDYRVGTFGLGRVPNGQGIINCTLVDQARGLCVHIDSTIGGFNRFANDRTTSLTTGLTTTIGADISGGAENVQYFISGTRNRQLGGSKLPEVDRLRLQEHIGGELPGWMKRPLRQNKDNVTLRLTGQPAERIDYSITGNLIQLFQTAGPNGISNNSLISPMSPEDTLDLTPGWELVAKQRKENVTRFSVAGSATARPFPFLTLSGTIGRDYAYRTDSEVLRRGWCWNCRADTVGTATEGKGMTEVRSVNFNGTLMLPINSSWTSRTAFGGQYQRTTTSDTYRRGRDLPRGATSVNSANDGLISQESSDDRATVGTFIDQSFAFRERLFVSMAVRRDLGSALGRDVTPLFPKWSASWVISDESFFPWRAQGVTLRLRAAFGHAGTQPASLAKYRSYSEQQYYLENGKLLPIMTISGIGNADLRPERSTEREGGFELGLWDERAVLDMTVFRKFTRDALVNRALAPSIGLGGTQWFNVGNVLNTGLEATLTARVLDGDMVTGNITIGYASRKNKLVTLGPNVEPYTEGGGAWDDAAAVVRAGYPLFGRWATPLLGFDDLNGDGIIAPDEIRYGDSLTFVGPSEAKADLSISPSIGLWRDRVTISALFAYVHGLTQFNEEAARTYSNNPAFYNPSTPLATQACFVARYASENYSCFYETVNYLRWNNFSVSYHVPAKWAQLLRANSATVALLGSNLGVWSNYRGMDPGLNSVGPSGNVVSGHTTVQLPHTWTLRMRLTF